jgi:hypothetical protein
MLPLDQIHIMKLHHVYIVVFVTFILFSCGGEKVDSSDGVFLTKIIHSAGDSWGSSFGFLPSPVNISEINDKKILVISDRIEVGSNVSVLPLGAVRLIENDSLKTYVLGVPTDEQHTTINAKGFDEFSTVHSSAKWIIEQYLINRKGDNRVALKSWENEKSAINYLQN